MWTDVDRLCLIDPTMRGEGVNRLSSSANPKGGLFLFELQGIAPISGLSRGFLPLCFCFAAAVLFVDSSSLERTGLLPTRSTWLGLAGLSAA